MQHFGETVAVRVVERRQISDRGDRRDQQFVRPVRRARHPRAPRGRCRHQSIADRLVGQGACAVARQLGQRSRWQQIERVDLAVRVGDGGADFGAAVLEHEDVLDVVARAELGRSLGPQVDDAPRLGGAELPERSVVFGRVQHDLGPTVLGGWAAGKRRPAVGERPHVVGIRSFEATGAERAIRRGQVRPRLAIGDDVHDLAAEGIDAVAGRCVAHGSNRMGT